MQQSIYKIIQTPSPDSCFVPSVDEGNAALSRVPLSKWEKMGDSRTFPQGKKSQYLLWLWRQILLNFLSLSAKTESKWDTIGEQDSEDEAKIR